MHDWMLRSQLDERGHGGGSSIFLVVQRSGLHPLLSPLAQQALRFG